MLQSLPWFVAGKELFVWQGRWWGCTIVAQCRFVNLAILLFGRLEFAFERKLRRKSDDKLSLSRMYYVLVYCHCRRPHHHHHSKSVSTLTLLLTFELFVACPPPHSGYIAVLWLCRLDAFCPSVEASIAGPVRRVHIHFIDQFPVTLLIYCRVSGNCQRDVRMTFNAIIPQFILRIIIGAQSATPSNLLGT